MQQMAAVICRESSEVAMWKPGTARPKERSGAQKTTAPPNDVNALSLNRRKPTGNQPRNKSSSSGRKRSPARSTASGGLTKKKLSGATMGMRFMQRKAEAVAAAKQKKDAEEMAAREREITEWKATRGADDGEGTMEDEPMSVDDEEEGTSGPTVPQAATVVDMYGEEADIIGRRSFGGFHKVVSDTWQAALEMRSTDRPGSNAAGEELSDQELLRRYERYVRGKGDMSGGTSSAPIGNLEEKVKKQKRNEKRKRL